MFEVMEVFLKQKDFDMGLTGVEKGPRSDEHKIRK